MEQATLDQLATYQEMAQDAHARRKVELDALHAALAFFGSDMRANVGLHSPFCEARRAIYAWACYNDGSECDHE